MGQPMRETENSPVEPRCDANSCLEPFRWKNCRADVMAWKHGITARLFFDDVISPAIYTIERKIAELGRSDNPSDIFVQADMKDVLRETKMAFSLSVQSVWERQVRSYLRGCAEEIRPGTSLAAQAGKSPWEGLCSLFLDLRGIRLEAFPSFGELETLQLLGNACRHGDGPSAAKLAERCPELWPAYPRKRSKSRLLRCQPPPVTVMDVPVDRLRVFVVAISTFWSDIEYIYNESIECKHPSLEARLVRERAERYWRPTMAFTVS